MRTPVSVGVVGVDEWGIRLARVFSELPRAELRWLCDGASNAPLRTRLRPPHARRTDRIADLLDDEMLDAVVVSTPAATRHDVVRRALEARKHVLTRSPIALDGAQADELARLAQRHDLQLVGAHDVVFQRTVQRLKDLTDIGRLGDVNYIYASRHRSSDDGLDALWDIAAQDIPLILYLLGDEPVEVWARGESYVAASSVDVVFCHLRFATGICAHLHASSLEPRSAGRLTVVGSERLAVLDETEFEQRLTVDERERRSDGNGAVHSQVFHDDRPHDGWSDALHRQCEHFLSAVTTPFDRDGGRRAAAVVNVLEALKRSLESGTAEPVRQAPTLAKVTALAERRERRAE